MDLRQPVDGVPGKPAGHEAACHRPIIAPLPPSSPSLSVVIVTYDSAGAVALSLPAIVAELRDGDELIVCDNESGDGTVAVVGELAPAATLIEAGENLGFAAGCNRAAAAASGELLLLLNPDDVVAARLSRRDRAAARRGPRLGRLAGADHRRRRERRSTPMATRSTSPGSPGPAAPGSRSPQRRARRARSPSPPAPAWRSGATPGSSSAASAPTTSSTTRTPTSACVSGSPATGSGSSRERSASTTTSSARARRSGATSSATAGRRSSAPTRGGCSRWCCPALLATELALLVVAAVGGWLPQKLRANVEVLASLPRLLRERREIQANAAIDAGRFAELLRPDLDSSFLGRAGSSQALNRALRAYWQLALRLL